MAEVGEIVSVWDQMVKAYGQGTTEALAGLELLSAVLVVAAVVAFLFDIRARRAQRIVDERERQVQEARRARGLS